MASTSRNFSDFANTLSFYNSNSTTTPLTTAAPSSSPSLLSTTPLTISLENRPLTYPIHPSPQASTLGEQGKVGKFISSVFGNANGGVVRSQLAEGGENGSLLGGYGQKGLAIAKSGVSTIAGSAKTFVGIASSMLQEHTNNNNSSSSATNSGLGSGISSIMQLNTTRLMFFAAFSAVGCLFMALAFLFPMVLFSPIKFAMMFTMGSLCFMISFGFLRGFKAFFIHIISFERLPFTLGYAASLFLTLYSSLVSPNLILALLFSVVQMAALASFLLSYIPGGRNMLKFVGAWLVNFVKNLCKRTDRSPPSLPI